MMRGAAWAMLAIVLGLLSAEVALWFAWLAR